MRGSHTTGIIDLDPPVSFIARQLAGGFGYQDMPASTGVVTGTEPFETRLDLSDLR